MPHLFLVMEPVALNTDSFWSGPSPTGREGVQCCRNGLEHEQQGGVQETHVHPYAGPEHALPDLYILPLVPGAACQERMLAAGLQEVIL